MCKLIKNVKKSNINILIFSFTLDPLILEQHATWSVKASHNFFETQFREFYESDKLLHKNL